MDFYSKLSELNAYSLLNNIPYEIINFHNSDLVDSFIRDILLYNKKVLIYGDYDPDGAMCALQWIEFFKFLGHRNFIIYNYFQRMHTLDPLSVETAINNKVDYIIINDAGSGALSEFKRLQSRGIKCILLDHHKTENTYRDYPDNVAIINTTIENDLEGQINKYQVSAGGLVYLVLDRYLRKYKNKTYKKLACLALVSLYSDSMDMSNPINRSIYYEAISSPTDEYPDFFYDYLNEYVIVSRRFFEWILVPRLNALFRAERFNLLNRYLFSKREFMHKEEISAIVSDVIEFHGLSSEIVKKISDIVDYSLDFKNFVIADLNTVNGRIDYGALRIENYTGLVANNLAGRFGKPCICLYSNGNVIKGSFRDLQSRDFLSKFRIFSDSNGHPPAFGIRVDSYKFRDFIKNLNRLDNYLKNMDGKKEVITIKDYNPSPNSELLIDMAKYNEFSGSVSAPLALIEKRITGDMNCNKDKYGNYNYKWGNYRIKSSNRLRVGSTVLLKPTKGKDITLFVIS